jgi:hypothetical protein
MSDPSSLLPTCPRCAYDLSGASAVRAGADQETCSECGLEFQWRDVLDPERTVPNWFVERPHTGFVRAALGTWVRAWVAPWQFWRTVKMHFPMGAGKIAAFVALMVLLSHLASGVVPALLLRDLFGPGAGYSLAGQLLGFLLNPYWTRYDTPPIWLGNFSITFDTPRTVDVSVLTAIGTLCMMPFVPLLLRQTLSRFKVRSSHIWRIAVYSLASLPCMIVMHGLAVYAAVHRAYVPGMTGGLVNAVLSIFSTIDQLISLRLFCLLLDAAWLGLFWCFALSRYLRIPHAAGVSIAALVISVLIVVLAMIAIGLSVGGGLSIWGFF